MSKPGEKSELDRALALDIVRVTEATAVAAANWLGRGDEASADKAAASAMHREIARLPFEGVVVVGEGEEGDCPAFYMGEVIGEGSPSGAKLDLAVDPIEGATLCAKALPNAMSVLVVAERDSLLKVPPIYMEKVAIGPGYPEGLVDLDATPHENLKALAGAKGVGVEDLTVCVLDRPRHGRLIEDIRSAGAALRLIGDGDIAGVMHVTEPLQTDIDIYLGVGGAPEGVLAAAALACLGGQMQGRLVAANAEDRAWAKRAGIGDLKRKYTLQDMVSGDLSFAATGITDGSLTAGVHHDKKTVTTSSVVMRASTRTRRWIKTEHADKRKFGT
ncbi:class II fructose-bisphosphatase [Methyloceanibacter sp.]|uniref:class II fructose-bisphosphatase n=1 Tax=Methyloceanibacter sp. TaxID=1965321 RepID=UPI00207DF80E|nr:class II fructose-bisphosphatase [Methyloceanibacter sp.]GFO82737.1 MAG: fructose-1,6-bisphosphatase [Methyloceanibacter sp.]HML92281.1 class II fructose-bisphosphatase [Methyloceanibacter sp.]